MHQRSAHVRSMPLCVVSKFAWLHSACSLYCTSRMTQQTKDVLSALPIAIPLVGGMLAWVSLILWQLVVR